MPLRAQAVQSAFESKLGKDFAGHFADLPDQIQHRDARLDAALFRAAVGDSGCSRDAFSLRRVEIIHQGRVSVLEPKEAEGHPLLARGMPEDFSAALAEPFWQGALLVPTGAGLPIFGDCCVRCVGGAPFMGEVWWAFRDPAFGVAHVKLMFGDVERAVPTHRSLHIHGGALFAAGDLARDHSAFSELEGLTAAEINLKGAAVIAPATRH